MALSLLSASRTVLLIGDEALSVFAVNRSAAKLAGVVPWHVDDFDERVIRMIRHDCGGKPVLLVNDMTDQHFKGGQRMPKVSVMDKQNVLDRKLQVAFPNYPIRGALPIKQTKKEMKAELESQAGKGGGTPEVRATGGMYLFAAVPLSEPITRTMEVARKSMASITGLVLLPVESSDLVATLSARLSGKERKPSRWAIFVGQHKGGALRQVITRDGQLAMTRMTPVTDGAFNPDGWAAEVSQEFKATISYLSRFGYSTDDGTDVIVVTSPECGDKLKDLIDIPCNYTSFTVNEAARLLGYSIGLQEEQRFADPLHASWIGRKAKFILPMRAQELSSVVRPRQYAAAAIFVLLLGTAYFAFQLVSDASTMISTSSELGDQKQILTRAQADQKSEEDRMQALGFDVKLLKASINTYDDLEKNGMDPLPAIQKIGQALGPDLRLNSLKLQMVEPGGDLASAMGASPPPADPSQPAKKSQVMLMTLSLSFPGTIEPKVGVKQVDDLQDRLQSKFPAPGYQVTVTKQVADLVYTESTSGKLGQNPTDAEGAANQDYLAELQIRETPQ